MSKSEPQIETKNNKLKVLESRKEMLFQRFQKLYDYTKSLDNPKILEYFKVGLNNLEKSKTQLLEVVDEINLLSVECLPEYVPSYQVIEAADDLYCHIVETSKIISMNETNVSSLSAMKAQPRLPKIDLVEFSGDPKMWPIFYQNF